MPGGAKQNKIIFYIFIQLKIFTKKYFIYVIYFLKIGRSRLFDEPSP